MRVVERAAVAVGGVPRSREECAEVAFVDARVLSGVCGCAVLGGGRGRGRGGREGAFVLFADRLEGLHHARVCTAVAPCETRRVSGSKRGESRSRVTGGVGASGERGSVSRGRWCVRV